jgi:hypothetical protein
MKTPEEKVIEQIANLAESHWFNPAVFGRQLSEQPYYTLDRIMEMVAHIIRNQSIKHKHEAENGNTTEGLLLANELDKYMQLIKQQYQFKNLKLPQTAEEQKKFIKSLPEIDSSKNTRYSWVNHEYHGETAHLNVQAVVM